MEGDDLNLKQQRFCREYMLDLNATQAAIRAGYSAKTAESQGSRLLRHVKVKEYINTLHAEEVVHWKISKQDVIDRYIELAFGPSSTSIMRKYYQCETIKEFLESLTPEEEIMIKGITKTTKECAVDYNIRFHDPYRALDVLAKHLGVLSDIGDSGKCLAQLIGESFAKGNKKDE